MCCININVNAVGFKRINKNEMPIKNSIMQHFFDYKPSSEKVFIRKYLRDCEQRLNFNFTINAQKSNQSHESLFENLGSENNDDDDADRVTRIYKFIEIPSLVVLVT